MNQMKTKKMVLMGILISGALILAIIESFIPISSSIPGAKLGLANIITVVAVVTLTPMETLTILLLRILLGAIFVGGVSGFLYSLGGGILSLIMMLIIIKLLGNKISMIGVSVTGAFFHTIGQLLVASVMIQSLKIFTYLPILLGASIFAGVFVGFVANHLFKSSIMRKLFSSYAL